MPCSFERGIYLAGFDSQRHWGEIYSRSPESRLSWFDASAGESLTPVMQLVPDRRARIVDVGGGTSRLADGLVEAGYEHVSVLDISDEALAISKRRMGTRAAVVTWIRASVLEWASPEPLQLWHDRAVFHFFTKAADRAAYVRSASRAVAQGGFAVIEMFAPDGPASCSGLPVYRASPEAVAEEFAPGFELMSYSRFEHRTPGGVVQRFQVLVLQRG